jgi:sporulation protein YlmC with PRC-barrel domain
VSRLLRASQLVGHPVITLGGESGLEIKDVVFEAASGSICGFTLRQPGFLGKPKKDTSLPWRRVHRVGRDAVMIENRDAFADGFDGAQGDDVMGVKVLTDDGAEVGEITDVIVEVGESSGDVVGFEMAPGEALRSDADHVFMPMPDTISISGEHIVVPSGARDYVASDLTGFGGAVEKFRSQIGGGS